MPVVLTDPASTDSSAPLCHHYFPHRTPNTGDALVARAIRCALVKHFGPLRFVNFPANNRAGSANNDKPCGLQGENLARTNAQADLVVIGGSNLLEPWSRGRWAVSTDANSLKSLRPPVLLLGMGTGSDYGRRIPRPRQPAASQMIALHRQAFASAVRDQPTADALYRLGLGPQAAVVTGCPVTFLTPAPITAVTDTNAPLHVSFPPPRIQRTRRGRRYFHAAMAYIARLRDRGVPLLVTLHDARDVTPAQEHVPKGVDIWFKDNPDELIAAFSQCRGVIGFRLHAALLGYALGKPIVPVGLDWRGKGFIQTFDLQHHSIGDAPRHLSGRLDMLTEQLLNNDPALLNTLTDRKATFSANFNSFLQNAAQTWHAERLHRSG